MFSLILKDLRFQKRNFIFIIAYLLVFGFLFNEENGVNVATMIIPLATIIFVLTPWRYDESYKMDVTFCSMPIRRSDIVISRYINSLLYMIIMSTVVILISIVASKSGFSVLSSFFNISIGDYIVGIMYSMTIVAISFPMYFKFGTKKAKVTLVLFICMFIFMSKSLGVSNLNRIFDISNNAIVGFIVCCILFVVSITISLKVYENIEL